MLIITDFSSAGSQRFSRRMTRFPPDVVIYDIFDSAEDGGLVMLHLMVLMKYCCHISVLPDSALNTNFANIAATGITSSRYSRILSKDAKANVR